MERIGEQIGSWRRSGQAGRFPDHQDSPENTAATKRSWLPSPRPIPASAGVITDAFLATLAGCPRNSAIFTTGFSPCAKGRGVAIYADCTAVATSLQGSGFNGLAGNASTRQQGGVGQAAVVSLSPPYALELDGQRVGHPLRAAGDQPELRPQQRGRAVSRQVARRRLGESQPLRITGADPDGDRP